MILAPLSIGIFACAYDRLNITVYKIPLLIFSTMALLSNLLYIVAYDDNMFDVLLLSRIIYGIGGSKLVHRKYINKCVSKSNRE